MSLARRSTLALSLLVAACSPPPPGTTTRAPVVRATLPTAPPAEATAAPPDAPTTTTPPSIFAEWAHAPGGDCGNSLAYCQAHELRFDAAGSPEVRVHAVTASLRDGKWTVERRSGGLERPKGTVTVQQWLEPRTAGTAQFLNWEGSIYFVGNHYGWSYVWRGDQWVPLSNDMFVSSVVEHAGRVLAVLVKTRTHSVPGGRVGVTQCEHCLDGANSLASWDGRTMRPVAVPARFTPLSLTALRDGSLLIAGSSLRPPAKSRTALVLVPKSGVMPKESIDYAGRIVSEPGADGVWVENAGRLKRLQNDLTWGDDMASPCDYVTSEEQPVPESALHLVSDSHGLHALVCDRPGSVYQAPVVWRETKRGQFQREPRPENIDVAYVARLSFDARDRLWLLGRDGGRNDQIVLGPKDGAPTETALPGVNEVVAAFAGDR